jgi:hypothetical protein
MGTLLIVREWLSSVKDWLLGMPAASWAVIGTLGGVILANHAALKRLKAQFANDQRLRVVERAHALRREVYLTATEAVAASMGSIGRFADLNIPDRDLSQVITERMPDVAKVQMVGNIDVVRKTLVVVTELSAAVLRLSAKRMALTLLKQQAGLQEQEVSRSSKAIDVLLEMWRSLNISRAFDQRRQEAIAGNIEFQQKSNAEATQRRAEIEKELIERHLSYVRECVTEVQALGRLTVPALVALRRELDLHIDENGFAEAAQAAQEKQMADLNQFLATLEAAYSRQRE